MTNSPIRWICALIVCATSPVARAQPAPDPEVERRAFKVTDGFEVNLWAADPLLAKPIQMNWDARGRLWVASSSMYPQIKPGEKPSDKIIILEDRDGDGRADLSKVFADGLLIPTGVEPGDGGAYVANSTELIYLKDTNGDGEAREPEERRVVLSGFGTEDTHHLLHTFRWGNDGRLYVNQSIYIHSHVETPWGTRRLMGSGIWRFRPESQQFDVYARGMVNPWGHVFDAFGQSFSTDGAGGEGIYYSFPGSAFQSAKAWDGITDMPRILHGMNPGSPKYCGIEIVSGRHLPDDWQGNIVTNDFRANRVVRYQLVDDGGNTFVTKQLPDVITSTDVAFRPIDVKMGPDGAIYIADWYNPIINHGEVDFRDPRRDKTHGRIWRITAKGRAPVKRPTLVGASVESLLDQLKSPEGWTRHHAKQVLRERGAKDVVPALNEWVKKLDATDANVEHHRLEALWTYQTVDAPESALLTALLQSKLPQVRAAATRVLPDWRDRLPNAMELLAKRVSDDSPRVRMEAVRALARFNSADAFELATAALDKPVDQQVDYALWTTANEMQPVWMPAFRDGTLRFGGDVRRLAYALRAVKSPDAAGVLVKQLREGKIPPAEQAGVLELIASVGSPQDLAAVFEVATRADTDAATAVASLAALENVRRATKATPPPDTDYAPLRRLIAGADDERVRIAALRYAGALSGGTYRDELIAAAEAAAASPDVRLAACAALAEEGKSSRDPLFRMTQHDRPFELRLAAASALPAVDLPLAAEVGAQLVVGAKQGQDATPVVVALVRREGGAEAFAEALSRRPIGPDVAKLTLRAVNNTGRDAPGLTDRLREVAGVGKPAAALTPEQMTETVKAVQADGDAARGELIFRRADMACFQCHALGGAGGQLGPDLRAIGASSPVDYLIDSLLDPNKAIKDGYHSVVVATKKGEVFSGIKLSQDDKQIVLRDATHDAIAIPLASVRRERAGGSLMPTGLADSLTRGEFLDLVRFLSELGKPGPYGPDNALLVRRWRVLDAKAAAKVSADALPKLDDTASWLPAYANAAGVLPVDALAPAAKGQATAYAAAAIDVTSPGRIALHLAGTDGLALWVDGEPVDVKEVTELELDRGVHDLTFKVELSKRGDGGLRVELRDVSGSSGHAQPVGGR